MYVDLCVALYLSRAPRIQETQCWLHGSEFREWIGTKRGQPPIPPSWCSPTPTGHEFEKFEVQYFENIQIRGRVHFCF